MKKFILKNVVAVIVVGVVGLASAGALWYVTSSHPPSFNAVTATRGNIVASLSEAATVAAENNANLSFQAPGQIAHVYVKEGQVVSAGTILADLSSASLQANLQQANAALAAATAKLDSLQTGTRPEQLAIYQTALTNAQAAVNVDIGNAYTAADDAVHNQTDNLFSNAKSNNPMFLVPMTDSQALNNLQSNRLVIEGVLAKWYTAQNITNATAALGQIKAYLDAVALAVNGATANSMMTPSVIAAYKVNVSTARAEVGTAITTLTTAQSAVATAQGSLSLAQAGSTSQDIEAQQAVVAQAQAGTAAAQVALNNASIVAPFSGTAQNVTAQIGQVVSPGVPVMSLVNNSGLKIQAYASEADVAKIKTGTPAQVMLDAFGTQTIFPTTVSTIGSTQTMVNGTPAYLVVLHFTQVQSQVKDGMTGNVQIILAEHDNVVKVPSRLVINNNNNYFVLITASDGSTQQKPVQVGLVGNDGMTEITSGLNAGDQLTNF